jgi:hypothetical protein
MKKFYLGLSAVVIIGGYSYVKGINNIVVYEQGINEAWVPNLPKKK